MPVESIKKLDYLLDTTALNKKMADRKDNPYRWKVGTFHAPKGCKGESLKQGCKRACDAFVSVMEKQGCILASKLQVYGPYPAHDLMMNNIIVLDKQEMRVRGIFKTIPKPVRIELPPSSVKGAEGTLASVMKGEGMRAVPRKERPIR